MFFNHFISKYLLNYSLGPILYDRVVWNSINDGYTYSISKVRNDYKKKQKKK